MTTALRTRTVQANAHVRLHVVEAGTPGRPPLLLVHGFPDCHEVFSRMIDELARDFHVATFDLRGIGRSTPPRSVRGYRIAALLPDFNAVIDAVFGPTASVHLMAHDWGSVLAFSYLSDAANRRRIRSLTSVSGPHLALIWAGVMHNLKKRSFRGLAASLEQLGSSWYTFALQVPVIPELLFKNLGARMIQRAWQRGGVPADDPYLRISNTDVWNRTQFGMELYRQNVLAPPPVPARGSIDTPIMLVIPERDPFIRPSTFDNLSDYAPDVERLRLDASHWCPRSHPVELAAAIRKIVARTTRGVSEA